METFSVFFFQAKGCIMLPIEISRVCNAAFYEGQCVSEEDLKAAETAFAEALVVAATVERRRLRYELRDSVAFTATGVEFRVAELIPE